MEDRCVSSAGVGEPSTRIRPKVVGYGGELVEGGPQILCDLLGDQLGEGSGRWARNLIPLEILFRRLYAGAGEVHVERPRLGHDALRLEGRSHN